MAEGTEVTKVEAQIVQGDEAPPLTDKQVEWAVVTSDFMSMTQIQREYVRLWICKKKGYDPLTNAVMYIPDGKGGLKLYAGAAAAKSEKDRLKAEVRPVYMGPLCTMQWDKDGQLIIGAVVEPRLFVSIWRASSDGLGDTYDGSALALEGNLQGLENAFKKFLTQGTNRVIFRHSGNPFMDSSEAGDMDKGFAPPVAAPQPKQRVPAPKPPAQIGAQPVEATVVGVPIAPLAVVPQPVAEGIMEGVVLEPQPAPLVYPVTPAQAGPVAAQPPRPAPPRGIPQAGPGPSALPGPRPLPKSPLPPAKPPKV